MKKIISVLSIALIALPLSSCSQSPAAAKPVHYTKAVQLAQLPITQDIIGISPDGSYLVFINDQQIGTYPLDLNPGVPQQSMQPQAALSVDQGTVLPAKKQTQWAPDGKSFILSDIDATSVELLDFSSRNVCLFTVNGNGIASKTVTDEDTKTGALNGGSLLYAPSFSYDGKGIVYSTLVMNSGSSVYKADIASGKKQTVYQTGDRADIACLDLGGGRYFCCENGAQSNGSNSLFFIDSNQKVTQLQDAALGVGSTSTLYDIKSWSEDRNALLLARWKTGGDTPYIDAFFILKTGAKPGDYSLTPFPSDSGRRCLDAVLSPDGNSVIACEMSDAAKTTYLMLYDVSAGTKTTLLSSDTPFGFASTQNGNHESIYITKGGKLLVWFSDGYRLYQLE